MTRPMATIFGQTVAHALLARPGPRSSWRTPTVVSSASSASVISAESVGLWSTDMLGHLFLEFVGEAAGELGETRVLEVPRARELDLVLGLDPAGRAEEQH